ncbi:MAG: aminotransferase class IV [Bdellovibrionales bacterium]
MKSTKLVSINGKLYPPEEAKISVFDRGFLYGDAVYEVARSYGRVFFELEAHIARMFNSAAMIGMDLQQSEQDYIDDIYKVYSHVKENDMYMRIQISRGQGTIGLSTKNADKPNVVIYIRTLETTPEEYYAKGVSIVTTDRLRNSKHALDPNIKSGNYLNNLLAFREATKASAYESIMVNNKNLVTEGTTANVYMVKNGSVISPPDDFDILRGITRRIVKQLCKEQNIPFLEQGFSPQEMESADEVFLTSSTKEVLPVSLVNATKVKTAPGSISQKLGVAYKQYVKEYCAARKHLGQI